MRDFVLDLSALAALIAGVYLLAGLPWALIAYGVIYAAVRYLES